MTVELTVVISIVCGVGGFALSWLVYSRNQRSDAKKNGLDQGTMQADIDSIKRGVDEIRIDQKAQYNTINNHEARIMVLEHEVGSPQQQPPRQS